MLTFVGGIYGKIHGKGAVPLGILMNVQASGRKGSGQFLEAVPTYAPIILLGKIVTKFIGQLHGCTPAVA
ncbi:hypothetical protein Ptc2401_00684 [Prosthecochloris sp. CIB 2401]|nr:hypothetical protein Ptc2401_00684 [Prosthecochloris sp. CIB 2401]